MTKPKRLTGKERKWTAKDLMIYGNKTVKNKNIIHNTKKGIHGLCLSL